MHMFLLFKTSVLKAQCDAEISKFVFPNFHVISVLPNAIKYKTALNKKNPKFRTEKKEQVTWKNKAKRKNISYICFRCVCCLR